MGHAATKGAAGGASASAAGAIAEGTKVPDDRKREAVVSECVAAAREALSKQRVRHDRSRSRERKEKERKQQLG